MTTISAINLQKRYGSKTAVDSINFEVREGEFLVLVGPSGCGKTTTLRLIAGLEDVTGGEIRFGDRVVNDIRPRDRNIGMVFQDYAVFPHMTVFENIAYGLRSRRTPRFVINEKVPEAAQMFRIEHLLKRKPRQLSGGERQRVALARAVVRRADVYLFDEPLSNLDAQLRHQAREDILTMHHQYYNVPAIYVTHDQSEAMSMGDRIAVIRAGKIEQIGTSSELYTRPANLFVAYFIGAPSINLFDARLERVADELFAVSDDLRLLVPAQVRETLRPHTGKPVKLGIRPEDFQVPKKATFAVSEDNTMTGVLNEIEPSATGCTAYLSGTTGKDFTVTFKLRLPASYLGQELPLAVNTEKMQLFDAETEVSLLYPTGS